MSLNRYAARVDANQRAIIAALQAIGCSVHVIRTPVDLAVGFRGQTLLVEIKVLQGKRKPRAADYTPAQESFLATWRGGPVATVTDIDSAIRAVQAMGAAA